MSPVTTQEPAEAEQEAPVEGRDVIHTGSISSDVELDLIHNEAHKVYHPSFPVRLLYWLAFQAPFPYIANHHALEAARLRRIVVDLLTKVWFGHHLVARVVDVVDLPEGGHDFVTRLVRGQEPRDKERANEFLKRLDQRFLESGLPTWQTTPYNPHAITNFIEAPDGTYRIIDLESSLVAFLYPVSRLIGLVRLGQFPSFDDIDIERLQAYVRSHTQEIEAVLPAGERDLLEASILAYAEEQHLWHGSERRYLPRLLRTAFRLIDVPSWIRGIGRLTTRSQETAESFVRSGIDDWVSEGRLTADEGEEAAEQLSTPPVAYTMLHLGAHFAISLPLRFPFGAMARFVYTCVLRAQAEIGALRGRAAHDARQTHTAVVALVALLPGFGRLAYLFAGPLRSNALLLLVPLDKAAQKLPADGYERLHLRPLVDWWALPANAAARARASSVGSVRHLVAGMGRLRDHMLLIAIIAAANCALYGAGLYDAASSDTDWWFSERRALHTTGFAQFCAASLAGALAYCAFWRRVSPSPADASGIFLWPLAATWLVAFAVDDYLSIHETVGDYLAEELTGGVNLTDGPVMVGYACLLGGLLYLFRHEALAARGSSVLLGLAAGASGFAAGASLADEAWLPVHDGLTMPVIAAGFWLAAMMARLLEVRTDRHGRAVRAESPV